MSDELERLRADLEVLERYYGDNCCGPNKAILTLNDKIARLEAEAADPWREARNWIDGWRKSDYNAQVVAFFDHLTADRDRLAARVVELEGALEPPFGPSDDQMEREIMSSAVNLMNELCTDADDLNDTKTPEFETAGTRTVKYAEAGPLDPREVSVELDDVDDDPILDPARVLTTAFSILGEHVSWTAKPYRLKGGENV